MIRRASGCVCLAASALVGLLVGCGDTSEPAATPSPGASTAPDEVVSIDEARDVYEGFLHVSAEMWDRSEVDYTLWLEYSSAEIATSEAAGQTQLRQDGVASMGPITVTAMESAGGSTTTRLDAFVCLDFTEATRLDGNGVDITPDEAVDYAPLQVRFERDGESLLLTEQEALPQDVESPCPA